MGLASRIAGEAFALESIKVAWEFYPWACFLQLTESGKRDGSAVWLYSAEREQQLFISYPVIESGTTCFTEKPQL